MLASQYLIKALQPSHPSYEYVSSAPAANSRLKKHTLRSRCWDFVAPLLPGGQIPRGEYRATLAKIHTKSVEEGIASLGVNRVLQAQAPQVDSSERRLPRPTRAALCQLRSGHCSRLSDYQFRIGRVDSPECSECHQFPASSSHIFECPSHPTSLGTRDLWEKPYEVASFLSNHPSFADLPDPGPPPQTSRRARPPPEPPPTPPPPPG